MQIGEFAVDNLSHVSFLFRSPEGTAILTDPFFAKSFIWKDKVESYLSPPSTPLEEIRLCDAIFISHIHGDHCNHEAIKSIHDRTRARILAADEILESLQAFGIPEESLIHIEDGVEVKIKDVKLTPLCGYDNSFDEKGRPNKSSIILNTGSTSLFYAGDCHEMPPGLKGKSVEAIFLWPHPRDETLIQFYSNAEFGKFILMHGDHFEPGDFLCNLDYSVQKDRIEKLLPYVEVTIPQRTEKIE